MPMAYSKLMAHSQPVAPAHVGEADGEEGDGRGDEQEVHGSPAARLCTTGATPNFEAGSRNAPCRLAFRKRRSGRLRAACDGPVSNRRPTPEQPFAHGAPVRRTHPDVERREEGCFEHVLPAIRTTAVTLVLAVVMAFLAGFGALMGAAAGLIMNRFFKMLLKS